MYKILNNYIDCIELLSKVKFYVPARALRDNTNYFYIEPYNSDFVFHSCIKRLSKTCNENRHWLDIYNPSISAIKNKCARILEFN